MTQTAQILAGAARAVAAVRAGHSADEALAGTAGAARGAAVRAVALGTIRWSLRLDACLAPLLRQPPQSPSPVLRALLLVALHQLEYSRHRPELSVSGAVEGARLLGAARAAGFVNALLRRYLRERVTLIAALSADPSAAAAHPRWLYRALQAAWPDDIVQILAGDNAAPPMTLRLDTQRVGREAYLARLAGQGIHGAALPWLDTALIVDPPVNVTELPDFDKGVVSVQDAGAQYATQLLGARPGERVLDACAAPGGKSAAILQQAGGPLSLTALDADPARLRRVGETLERIGASAQLIGADLRDIAHWWDGNPFDRILLDAPCSATGVIRRHPDIKLLRREADIGALANLQRQLLSQCWALLRPGGRLLYCTCSVLPAENAELIGAWLIATPGAHLDPMPAGPPGARLLAAGMQLLPGGEAQADGFYYACLTRR